MGLAFSSYSQPPPPPGGSSGTGRTSGNKLGGSVPIGSGYLIFLALSGAYAGVKFYKVKRKKLEE